MSKSRCHRDKARKKRRRERQRAWSDRQAWGFLGDSFHYDTPPTVDDMVLGFKAMNKVLGPRLTYILGGDMLFGGLY